jgi:anti-sigma regulatory factor (Ser/Thr protein kinase)
MTPTYRAAFSGDYRNVPLARSAIASFARICGFTREEVEDIRLAAGEALNNAVEHGHAARYSGFSVHCTFKDDEVTIEICDNGGGFATDSPISETPGARGRGFGIFLMRKLMDVVRFERDGTCVRLVRRHTAPDHTHVTA